MFRVSMIAILALVLTLPCGLARAASDSPPTEGDTPRDEPYDKQIHADGLKRGKEMGFNPIVIFKHAEAPESTIIAPGCTFSERNGSFALAEGDLVINAGELPAKINEVELRKGEAVLVKDGKLTKFSETFGGGNGGAVVAAQPEDAPVQSQDDHHVNVSSPALVNPDARLKITQELQGSDITPQLLQSMRISGSGEVALEVPATGTTILNLKFTGPGVLRFMEDGTLLATEEHLRATDSKGKVWTSRKTVLDGKELIAFFPDADSKDTAAAGAPVIDPDDASGIQQMLTKLGYDTKGVDGAWGKNSSAALSAFQRDAGLPASGKRDEPTLSALAREQSLHDQILEQGKAAAQAQGHKVIFCRMVTISGDDFIELIEGQVAFVGARSGIGDDTMVVSIGRRSTTLTESNIASFSNLNPESQSVTLGQGQCALVQGGIYKRLSTVLPAPGNNQ